MNKKNKKRKEEGLKRNKGLKNKLVIGGLITIGILVIAYLGISVYFTNHFYLGSSIDTVNISGNTVVQANAKIEKDIKNQKLEIIGRDGLKTYITNNEIGLKYDTQQAIELKNKQNPFKWIFEMFNENDLKIDISKTYNNELLESVLNNKVYKDSEIAPKNASLKYVDGKYEIVKEVYGNKLNKDKVNMEVLKALEEGKTQINLENLNCYYTPEYLSDSEKVIDTKKQLNKYLSAKITYIIGDNTIVVEGDIIKNWISADKDMNPTINEGKVKSYVSKLANEYDTAGKPREFKTSLGTVVKVSGGDFGWKINVQEETNKLIADIKAGKQIQRKPVYAQEGLPFGTQGVGNTYVEVNLSKQHIWFYKDGKLVVQGDVVTGNVSKKVATPQGVYRLKYKEKDTHLKGENYNVPVKYWMPFNGGIGLHDAWWRKKFGGDIYKKDGSHGCVNLPANVAESIFNNITAGTPVVVYN